MNATVSVNNRRTRILVVDDSVEIATVFSMVLRGRGYQVYEAHNGQEAMQFVTLYRPDVVLLDVILPDISGIEVCRYIKTDQKLRSTMVVLISGEAMSVTHKVDGFETGADEYLTKPIAINEFVARIRTIVQLQQSNAALRASEEHYRRLVEILPDAVALVSLGGRIVTLNSRTVTMMGYDSADELNRARIFKLARRDQWPKIIEGVQTLQKTGVMWNSTCMVIRKDQTELPLEINATLLFESKDSTHGVLLVARDLTERLWVERLMQIQRDYGLFLSSANNMHNAINRLLETAMQIGEFSGGLVYLKVPRTQGLNLEAYQGLSEGQLKSAVDFGKTAFDRGGGAMENIEDEVKSVFGLGNAAVVIAPIHHGKSLVAILLLISHHSMSSRVASAVKTIAAQTGDAIGRIRIEESLRASQQLLDKTLNSIHAAVLVVNALTDRILECNRTAVSLFGYAKAELNGTRTCLLHVNLLLWRHFRRRIRTEQKECGIITDFEMNMKRKDESIFPVELSIAFIRNDAGIIIRYVMVIRDIRERKKFEEQLLQLPNRIMEAQEAERKRVARELHDGVNQLIASAKMRLQRVEDRLVSLNPTTKELLDRAYNLMVQALEENRRIAHNLRPSDLDELGLPDACRNYCEDVRIRSNLAFSFVFNGLQKRLSPDTELHLFRILQEALTNIEKHAKAKSVFVELSIQSDSVLLRVKDDGCGSDFQHTGKRDQKSGMGLANMKERVLLIGGTFDVSSSPNNGVTITVAAPRIFTAGLKESSNC